MKALFINGSPRKNWTTFKMIDQAMKGAADAGADAELIHLYDYDFKGCRSCFACKLKNAKTNGVCAIKDCLRPILEKAHDADVLVIGSPIYFGRPSGVVHSFMERLLYPVLASNPKKDEKTGEYKMSLLGKRIPNAVIYTMGATEKDFYNLNYPIKLEEDRKFLELLYGETEMLCTHDAYQYADYSKIDILEGIEERRAKQRGEVFPKDLEASYELGKRLVEKARSV